jgi:Fe-S cluster assembly protein SufD
MSTAIQEKEILFKSTDARPDRIASSNPSDFAVPNGREEEWRYTPLKRLGKLHEEVTADQEINYEVVAPAGITYTVVDRKDVATKFLATDRVSSRTESLWNKALVIEVAKELETKDLTWVKINLKNGVQYGHIIIKAKAHSKATIILEHVGEGIAGVNCEIIAEDGSNIDFITVFDLERKAVIASEHQFVISKDANIRSLVVQLGGDIVRYVPRAKFSGNHASVELLGVFLATRGQFFENRVFVDHNMKDCKSNVLYRGGAHGEGSHTVWVGDVLIRKIATGTNTYEMNRNLLLDNGARADSVPNLEIETGEVEKAGHASVTGRLDDDQLFYLMSRGIDEHTARQLVIEGFFAGIFGEFSHPELKERLNDRLNAAIERSTK